MPRTQSRGLELAKRLDPQVQNRTRRAREAFLDGSWDGSDGAHRVRSDILQSWRRSRANGVVASGAIPRVAPPANAGPLIDAARPALDHLAQRWRDASVWGFVLDRTGTQVLPVAGSRVHISGSERVGSVPGAYFGEDQAGTNGAALALLLLRPYLVVGHEHYPSAALPTVTIGLPVRDSLKRTQGFLVLCSRVDNTHPMLVPYGIDLANSISDRLSAATDPGDRALFEAFIRHSATPSVPVAVFNDRFCALNTAAQQLLGRTQDLDLLRDTVHASDPHVGLSSLELTIGDERYRLHCQALDSGRPRPGVVVTLQRVRSDAVSPPVSGFRPSGPAAVLERARDSGIGVLVRGEPGSGRAHLVQTSGPLREMDAGGAAPAPEAWLDRLKHALTTESALLIRDLDALSPEGRRIAASHVRASAAWCAATVRSEARDLEDAFPVTIECAALRTRKDDIPEIVGDILTAAGAGQVRCSSEVLGMLAQHDWPGNVGELRAVVLTALTAQHGDLITIEHLPRSIALTGPKRTGSAIDQMERALIFEALKSANWNRNVAADALGISRSTMYRRLRRFPFQIPSSRS